MTQVVRQLVDLPPTELITRDTKKEDLLGNVVVAPPSAHGSIWLRKMSPFVTATASGWMAFRGARARRAIDKGFVLSDHCDWYGLLDSIKATGCEKVIATHGYSDIFSRYLRELGYDARTAKTQYEGESAEMGASHEGDDASEKELENASEIKMEENLKSEKSIRTLLK
jgi:putative mRNA 3-end processing factor